MKDQIEDIVDRFWKDISSMPWHEQGFRPTEETRVHFVTATVKDLLKIMGDKEKK